MNLSTTDPAGHLTRYGHYPDGKLKTLTDPNGNLTTWERDIQGRARPRCMWMPAGRPTPTSPVPRV